MITHMNIGNNSRLHTSPIAINVTISVKKTVYCVLTYIFLHTTEWCNSISCFVGGMAKGNKSVADN